MDVAIASALIGAVAVILAALIPILVRRRTRKPSLPGSPKEGKAATVDTNAQSLASSVVGDLLDAGRLPRLVAEWRDKILGKMNAPQLVDLSGAEQRDKIRSYLIALETERRRYVQESRRQIKTLPDTLSTKLRKDYPENGLAVALATGATTSAFADHIKASEKLLELLPRLIHLCDDPQATLQSIAERANSAFDDLLFQLE